MPKKKRYGLIFFCVFLAVFSEGYAFSSDVLHPSVIDSNINVAAFPEIKYVEGVSWRPYKVTFKQGEEITFVVNEIKGEPLSQLEFRVFSFSTSSRVWTEVIPWHDWPLPSFIYTELATSAIQVDVHKKNAILPVQKMFLGNFFLQKEDDVRDHFLAEIIAHHRNPETMHEVLEKAVAKELKLGIYLLYWSYLNLSLEEKQDRAKQLDIGRIKGHLVEINTDDDVKLIADLKESTITDNVVTLKVSLASHAYFSHVLEQVEDLRSEEHTSNPVT